MTAEVEIPESVRGGGGALRLLTAGQRFWMGEMRALSTVLSIEEVVHFAKDGLVSRQDFTLGSEVSGNRLIRWDHVEAIKKGVKANAKHLLLGTFILSTSPRSIVVTDPSGAPWPDPEEGVLSDVVKFGLRTGYRLDILDAQHRSAAMQRLWDESMKLVAGGWITADEFGRLLSRSSVPVTIVLETDPRELRRMFVSMASTRPIPQALVAAMDEFRPSNRLGIDVARHSKLLGDGASRLEYMSTTAKADKMFVAHAVRSAAVISLVGFKDRTPSQRDQALENELLKFPGGTQDSQLEHAAGYVAAQWNYAAERMPGWREVVHGKKTPGDARDEYMTGTAAALYVVASVLAACRAASIDYKTAIDRVAELPWRPGQTVEVNGQPQHRFFEGLLIVTERVRQPDGSMKTNYKRAGGNRSQYEGACRKVLAHLAEDSQLEAINTPEILHEIGLQAGQRGRPRKAA